MTRVRTAARHWTWAIAGFAAVWANPATADGLTYFAHAPIKSSAHPALIVLLHGAGSDERDMITMWRDLPQDFVVISPRAPFCEGSGCRWYRKSGATPRGDDLANSRKVISLVIDEAVRRFDADPARIFLGGFSQGGVMTYEVALREPGRFRGAVVLSGSMFASAIGDVKRQEASSAAFFVAHGTADPRIPFAAAQSAAISLQKLGVPVAFHAYPGMRHETIGPELEDLHKWLESREDRPTGAR